MNLTDKLKSRLKSIPNFNILFGQKRYNEIYKELGYFSCEFSQMLIDEQVTTGYNFLSDVINSFGTCIPEYAFFKCNFNNLVIDIPASINEIGNRAFYNAYNLKLRNKVLPQEFKYLHEYCLSIDDKNSDQFEEITMCADTIAGGGVFNRRLKRLNLNSNSSKDIIINLPALFDLTGESSELTELNFSDNVQIECKYFAGPVTDVNIVEQTFPKLPKSITDGMFLKYNLITPSDVINNKLIVNKYRTDVDSYYSSYPDFSSIEVDKNNPRYISESGCLYEKSGNNFNISITTSDKVTISKPTITASIHENLKEIILNSVNNFPKNAVYIISAKSPLKNHSYKINIINEILKDNFENFVNGIHAFLIHKTKLQLKLNIKINKDQIQEFLNYIKSKLNKKSKNAIIELYINNKNYIEEFKNEASSSDPVYKISFTSDVGDTFYLCFGKFKDGMILIKTVRKTANTDFRQYPQCIFKSKESAEYAANLILNNNSEYISYKVYSSRSSAPLSLIKVKNDKNIDTYIDKDRFNNKYINKDNINNVIINERFKKIVRKIKLRYLNGKENV